MECSQYDFLSQLSTEQFEQFKKIANKKCVPADTVVIHEDDQGQSFYYIAEGEVSLTKAAEPPLHSLYSGLHLYENIQFKTMAAGRFIGESHFFNNDPLSYSATTTKDTVLYELSFE